MGKTIIQVEQLSKAYRIGEADIKSDTLADAFMQILKAPVRNFRNLRNLRKIRHDDESLFWALRDINFEIREGEVLGIIGHNGAGKSTLLKILSRITEPTEGRITIHGRVSSLLEVGTGFHPDLTGRENIYMNGTILGMRKKEIDSKLDEIIAFSGISRHIDTPVKRYSSGMAVRLAFSVAAHLEPEILVIDEVLAVGDAEFQNKCLGKMNEVAHAGRTVLFVSHNMAAVRSLCKKVILLKGGNIVYHGGTTDGIDSYLSQRASAKNSRLPWVIDNFALESCKFTHLKSEKDDITSGDGAKLEYSILSHGVVENPISIAWISNQFGDRILLLSSRLSGLKISRIEGRLSFQITINNLMLMAGSYFLNIGLLTNVGRPLAFWENVDIINVSQNPEDPVISLPDIRDRGVVYSKYIFKVTS